MNRLLVVLAGLLTTCLAAIPPAGSQAQSANDALTQELVGHWPLRGDTRDQSGQNNHGKATGAGAEQGNFDGRQAYIEVPSSASLDFGRGDFTLCAWVWTAPDTDRVLGDVLSQFNPQRRRGFNLSLKASAGGYSSQGDDRHVVFGIDDSRDAVWEDCGRPSATSNYISNALTVFDGHLYAPITDAVNEADWCHVFRYKGGQTWEDCGRVGNGKTRGVGGMVVHQGKLYASTWSYDWTRVHGNRPGQPPYPADSCRVYRYAGGKEWEDMGQPGNCPRLFGIATFKGRLYVAGDDGVCYVHAGEKNWREAGRFPRYAHPLAVHDGRLYAGLLDPAGVDAFDGTSWKSLGNPQPPPQKCTQIHDMDVYQGKLHVTTWPLGHVMRLEPDDKWTDCGRLGDSIEMNALTVYNGKLYSGSIPRAEVFRYDDGTAWASMRRFLDPAGYTFKDSREWARVTSLTIYAGKLFAGMGSCTSSHLDAPADFRGQVYAMQVGQCVSHDRDIGAGWKHLAAVKRGDRLELFVDGTKVAESAPSKGAYDLTPGPRGQALRIGFGEKAYFAGKIREVRAYRRALEPAAIARVKAEVRPE